MITCLRCGARLEDDFLYCEECGALLKTAGSDAAEAEEALYNVCRDYRQPGPYKMAQLLRMAENGQITKDHWICPAGASGWLPVTAINELITIIGKKPDEVAYSVPQAVSNRQPAPAAPDRQDKGVWRKPHTLGGHTDEICSV
ncbi:MAG: DUF4339 domain-containing protein, partial [Treponema sp.]|nr:DUF4339 domain-containing protein [Treponema sp.]